LGEYSADPAADIEALALKTERKQEARKLLAFIPSEIKQLAARKRVKGERLTAAEKMRLSRFRKAFMAEHPTLTWA
jgi:hypothetical protein